MEETFKLTDIKNQRFDWLKKELQKPIGLGTDLISISTKLYEKGYSGIDIIHYIDHEDIEPIKKYKFLLVFNKIKKEFRNEKLLMLYILNFLYLRSDVDLENISFI